MRIRLVLSVFGVLVAAAGPALAAGPLGHFILANKAADDVLKGVGPAPDGLKDVLKDPECRRAFCGGSVAPDICEEASHYGSTGQLARKLLDSARSDLKDARDRGDAAGVREASKELAFAYGWMAHCATDLDLHPKVNELVGDSYGYCDKGQKLAHGAREAQFAAYLTRLMPDVAKKPFDVAIPYEFLGKAVAKDPDALKRAMAVLKGKTAAEIVARSKVTLTDEQLRKLWGPVTRQVVADTRTFTADPSKFGDWDLDAGRISTEEFAALHKLVLELNGGKLPANWAKSYLAWYARTKGLGDAERRKLLAALIKGQDPNDPGGSHKLLTARTYYPNKQLRMEYTYYLDANHNQVRHGIDRQWSEKGVLTDEVMMREGKMDGVWRHWYATGELAFEETWTKGVRTGSVTRYYKNGKVDVRGQSRSGAPVGVWTYYYESGKKRSEDDWGEGGYKPKSRHAWSEDGKEIQIVGD